MTSPGGPGGKEVGRVSIRVVPDTSRFRQELKDQLEALPDTDYEFDAKGDVDEKQLAREARSAARAASTSVDFDANLTNNIQAEARKFAESVEKAAEGLGAKVPVDADTKEAEKKLDRFQRRYLNKVEAILTDVDLTAPLTFEGELDRATFEDLAKGLKKQIRALDVEADAEDLASLRREVEGFYQYVRSEASKADLISKEQIAYAQQRLKRFADKVSMEVDFSNAVFLNWDAFERAVESADRLEFALRPTVDIRDALKTTEAGARQLREVLRGAVKVSVDVDDTRLFKTLARLAPAASVAARGVSSALTAIKIPFQFAASGVSVLAKGLAALGPQAIAITALVAALLPPVLALGSGLITLAPSLLALAVPFGAVMLGLDGIKKAAETAGPAFETLKATISETFSSVETGMVKGFEVIRDRLIPGITLPLQGAAEAISGAFNGVVDSAASPTGLSNIQKIIDNVAAGIRNATGGLKGFTDGLLQLVASISEKFPGIGTWFTELGTKFSNFITEFTTLPKENGLTGLENLIANVRTGIEGLTGVFQAFFSQGLKDIQDPNFGSGMKNFFDSVKAFVTDTLPSLSEGFKQIADLLKQMEPLFKGIGLLSNIGGVFTKPGETITNAVERFKAGDGKNFSDALFGVGGVDKAFAGVPEAAGKAGAEAQASLAEGFAGAGAMGVGGMPALQESITAPVQQAVEQAKTATAGLGAQVQTDMAGVSSAITTQWTAIQSAVTTGITGMQTTISSFFTALPQGFTGAFTGIQQSITGMFILIAQSISTQSANLSNSFATAFQGIPGRIAQALSGTPAAITGALAGVAGAVAVSMAAAAQAANEGGAATAQVAAASFGTVAPAISGAMQPCITTVSTICQQMVSTASSFAGAMEQSGVAIGASFARGIASQASLVASSANALMAAARAFFPNSPADEGPFSGSGWVDKSGASIGVSFADGISSSMKGVVSTARELMQAVKDVFGSAEGLTINFNLGGVADQAQAATTAVKDFGTAVGTIPPAQLKSLQPEVSAQESQFTKDELDRQLAILEIERKSLEIERAKTGANEAAIKARLEEIKQQKLQLGLQKNQLDYATKYGEQTDSMATKMDDFYKDIGKKVVGLPTDFAKATGQQFMQDLGMSGEGAIPNLLREGANYIFQVSDMQSALTAQRTLVNKQAAGVTQR